MTLSIVQGKVANFQSETEIERAVHQGGAHGSGTTNYQQKKVLNFRVGRTPINMVLGASIDLTDGDNATVAGSESGGPMDAVAVRNDETNMIYFRYGPIQLFIWAVILIVAGIPLTAAIIGWAMIPAGAWLGYKGMQVKNAIAMINNTEPVITEEAV